jgi:DNA-binding protein H-NS
MEKVNDRELKAARDAAIKAAAKHGFSLEELTGTPAPTKKKPAKATAKKASPPKYRSPDDAKVTWTGKGRKPEWFKAAIEAGTSPEAMEI